jgi:uncharacterized membrane protein YdbT with pleckstrin-like domain
MFELQQSVTRTAFPLSKKKILKKAIYGMLGKFILLMFLGAIFVGPVLTVIKYAPMLNSIFLGLIFLAIILTFIFSYIYEILYFNTYYYELTESFVIIRKGVLSTKEINIPYDRIQDVYVDQDILDRIFGLYDVHISSATVSSGWLAHIDGVLQDSSQGLKNAILSKIQIKRNTPNA